MIQSVVIIGSGNVAHHLGVMLKDAGCDIVQVFGRNAAQTTKLAKQLNAKSLSDLNNLHQDADLYLVMLSDHLVPEMATLLPKLNGIVAHTSGSTPLSSLNSFAHHGVFYPLQTFKKEKELAFDGTFPILIEANSKQTTKKLSDLAQKISTDVRELNSEGRKKIHLAAVMLNNFTNHLMHLVELYVKNEELDFALLKPLLMETFLKMDMTLPSSSQTGPAIRQDTSTLSQHQEMLSQYPNIKEAYAFLSQSIQKLHKTD